MRLEQIVEPGSPSSFFESHRQSPAQSRKEFQNGYGFRFQDRFHDYLALGIHYRYRDRCLMNVEPNILFAVHEGAPFVGHDGNDHNLLPKGRPLIMRLQQFTVDSGLSLWPSGRLRGATMRLRFKAKLQLAVFAMSATHLLAE